MTFSGKVMTGLAAGVATGLFFGERAAPRMVADGFVKLLQMTVLPVRHRVDRQQPRAARLRRRRAVSALRVGRGRRRAVARGARLRVPRAAGLSVASRTPRSSARAGAAPRRRSISSALYIPSNPFNSLANNVVPAVVLFSVLVGVALIGVERKQVLLDVLQVVGEAVSRATRFVSKLTPYGLFAIAATAAGTLNVEQLGRLQIYLFTYVALALVVSLWVLPGLVAALTPVPALDLLRSTRNSLITAFVAGDLFIVLPSLIDESKDCS